MEKVEKFIFEALLEEEIFLANFSIKEVSLARVRGRGKEDKSRIDFFPKTPTRTVIVSNLAQHQQKAKKHNIWQRAGTTLKGIKPEHFTKQFRFCMQHQRRDLIRKRAVIKQLFRLGSIRTLPCLDRLFFLTRRVPIH